MGRGRLLMPDPADESATDVTALPRRRWGRRVLLTLLALALVLVVAQWQSGRRAARGLGAEVAACRAAGEPATVEELNRWEGLRSGSGENVVPLLRAAAKSIQVDNGVWRAAMDTI